MTYNLIDKPLNTAQQESDLPLPKKVLIVLYEMSSVNLMDIITTEYSLGIKILTNNKAHTTACINGVCQAFNKMTAEENTRHREEYYLWYLPEKIENTIYNKVFSMLKNPHNVNVYKKPEEYEADLEKLARKINKNDGYDNIMAKMVNLYEENGREFDMSRNSTSSCYIFGILMKECYDFLKNHMKHEITRKDYDTEDEDIDCMIVKYKWSCRGY